MISHDSCSLSRTKHSKQIFLLLCQASAVVGRAVFFLIPDRGCCACDSSGIAHAHPLHAGQRCSDEPIVHCIAHDGNDTSDADEIIHSRRSARVVEGSRLP